MRLTRTNGYSVVELPLGLWLAFIFFAMPFICLATIGYRAAFFYFAVAESCSRAATASSFTGAVKTCNRIFKTDVSSFNGISGPSIQLFIIEQPLPKPGQTPSTSNDESTGKGTAKISPVKLVEVFPEDNAYYVQAVGKAQINSLLCFGPNGWLGLNIPGLTSAFEFPVTYKKYVESPQGLTR
jgi:hypothetical protein